MKPNASAPAGDPQWQMGGDLNMCLKVILVNLAAIRDSKIVAKMVGPE